MNQEKQKTLIGLKKAQSLLERVMEMVKADKYCIDVMQQNLAVIGLLKSAHRSLMENHLQTCFKEAMESQNEKKKQAMIKEILKVTSLYNR